jgi:cyclic pyranopterin phosphate synthase
VPTRAAPARPATVLDRLGRPLRDLRVSVTDRCNFRCTYCMPREVFGPGFQFLDRAELLTFEEIARVVRVFARSGIRKLRLTGGEPLVRRNLERLVAMLAAIDGVDDLAMTTNGSLLARHAPALRAAGLRRVTVSLDTLDDRVFRAMSDVAMPLARVLEGIEAARQAGFETIKLNAVVRRGLNDDGILDLARFGREHGYVVRFIEYMDVGTTNGWRLDDVVPAAEIVRRIHAELPLEPVDPNYQGEVASRYRYRDGGGEVGVISSVTEPFCHGCTRARLSAVGELYTCLFAAAGRDLRAPLRSGASDEELDAFIRGSWSRRTDRYSEERSSRTAGARKVEMSYIGG